MKKKSLLLSIAFCACASVYAQEVVFDFSNPAKLSDFTFAPLSLSELQTAKYDKDGTEKDRCYKSKNNHVLVIIGETISKDGVSITLDNPDKYKDYPRLFFGLISKSYPESPSVEHFYCDLRWYQKQTIEITAPEGKKIEKIVMNATSGSYPERANGSTKVTSEGGTQTIDDTKTINEWVANPEAVVTKVTYKADADSPTQMAYSVTVTLADKDQSGIDDIEDDRNMKSEYFDLTGKAHMEGTLAPGIYILRKGSAAKKVIVK